MLGELAAETMNCALTILFIITTPVFFLWLVKLFADYCDTIDRQKYWDEAVKHKEQCKRESTPEWPRWDTTYGDIPATRPRTIIDKILKRPVRVY